MVNEMESERADLSKYRRSYNAKDIQVAQILVASGAIFCTGLFFLVHFDIIQLYPRGWTEDKLTGFALKAHFALRYQSLLMFWLLFNILATIGGRFKTRALNPLDGETEPHVQIFKNVLTNSYESIVISAISQLIFAGYAESITVLKFIPLINILMFIGRVSFYVGYPYKRGFGYSCTIFPTFWLVAYNTYKLGSFLGLYSS